MNARLLEVIENKGLFCALCSDRGSHFFYTPRTGAARSGTSGRGKDFCRNELRQAKVTVLEAGKNQKQVSSNPKH